MAADNIKLQKQGRKPMLWEDAMQKLIGKKNRYKIQVILVYLIQTWENTHNLRTSAINSNVGTNRICYINGLCPL